MTTDAGSSLSLETLLGRLLKDDPALEQSLNRLDLDAGKLLELIQPDEDEIRRKATAEADSLSVAEAQLKRATEDAPSYKLRRIPFDDRTIMSVFITVSAAAGAVLGLSFIPRSPRLLQSALQSLALLMVLSFMAWLAIRGRNERFNESQRTKQARYTAALGVDALTAKVDTARETLVHALITRGLLPRVIRLRAERDRTRYTTQLRYVSARGLSEVYDPATFEFETPAFQQIRCILDNTPGGSIGLAGPRGTGKSTVMASFVEGRSRRSDNKRGRAVRVSAPVDYVPRDFILHLFAELCEAVIVPAPPFLPPYTANRPVRELRRFSARNGYRIIMLASSLLMVWGLILLLNSIFKFWPGWRYIIGPAIIAAGAVGWWLSWLTWRSSVFEYRYQQEREEREQVREREALAARDAQPREGVPQATADLASKYLDLIRFQQTYTDGWSGSLTATVGLLQGDVGLSAGNSFLRNVLSLPDIVDFFKQFVTTVASEGPVIIGIDELDKIESAEKAQAFLNDIKSVFGVARCYFLVSISEEALANFERRGLPVRDAFDSALDDVIRVTPLDYPAAHDLIRIRIVGLPEPYTALIYCLSGGLPRDMIRWARALIVAKGKVGTGLTALLKTILKEDLERKISASIIALSRNPAPGAESAMRFIGSLKLRAEPGWLIDCCEEILADKDNGSGLSKGNGNGSRQSTAIISVTECGGALASIVDAESRQILTQLSGYFYFAATLIEVFRSDLTKDRLTELISGREIGTVRQLAHARQAFSTDPWLAIDEISSFRSSRRLKRLLVLDGPFVRHRPGPRRAAVKGHRIGSAMSSE